MGMIMNMNMINVPPLVGRNLIHGKLEVRVRRSDPATISYDEFSHTNSFAGGRNSLDEVLFRLKDLPITSTKILLQSFQSGSSPRPSGANQPRPIYKYKKFDVSRDLSKCTGKIRQTTSDLRVVALVEAFLGWLRFMVASSKPSLPKDCFKRILCEMNAEITGRLEKNDSAIKLAEIATLAILQNQNSTFPGIKFCNFSK